MHVPESTAGLTLRCLHFEELGSHTLYALLKLRQEVFCLEQECNYLDIDGKDPLAWHVLGYVQGELVATARLLMPGEVYADASIGRVVTSAVVRGVGLGRVLMQYAVEQCRQRFPEWAIRIGAQDHLRDFYRSFGFEICGDAYLEDGILHVEMVLPAA